MPLEYSHTMVIKESWLISLLLDKVPETSPDKIHPEFEFINILLAPKVGREIVPFVLNPRLLFEKTPLVKLKENE